MKQRDRTNGIARVLRRCDCCYELLFPATAAHAATAFVGAGALSESPDTVNFVADPGESNSVTVKLVFSPTRIEIHDAGATIMAGAGCSSVDANTVRCVDRVDELELHLGDGDDVLSLQVEFVEQGWYLGGGGEDTITAANEIYSLEHLRGGPGNDTLRGRAGEDVLSGGPGADVLRGGPSIACETAGQCFQEPDLVTYASRTNDVFVDQDGVADDGELGEGDMVADDIERIVGGKGNDRLRDGAVHRWFLEGVPHRFGTALLGGRGNDVLRGGRASNYVQGARGNDVLRGARHRDYLLGGKGDDTLVGGPGRDLLHGNHGGDTLLARDGRRDVVYGGDGRDRARVDSAFDTVRDVERLLL
jgi:Ca2+-binding RTX toxin-like protein